jgi:dienelactone hydrolase
MRIAPYEFEAFDFTHESKTCKVLRIGKGPGVVVMHEIFGLTKEVGRLAGLISEAGFTTYIPVLFGNADKPAFTKIDRYCNLVQIPLCLRKEFYLLATHQSSPITTWLRALCHQVHQACGGPGVGAIGMCLTGGFALSLMLDKFLLAPVMSQPSLPISCCSKRRKSALGLSDDELAIVKERVDSGIRVLGLRFTADKLCPPERFETLEAMFGERGFEAIEIDSTKGIPTA